MFRNYLMPGFALVLLAVFAVPRSTPTAGTETGASQPRATGGEQAATKKKEATAEAPQSIGSKALYSPKTVCSVARNEMHEKLAEFGLDYPEPGETEKRVPPKETQTNDAKETKAKGANGSEPAAEAIIALVPDPVHTHLALLFDRNVDVIQQALQDRTSEDAAGWIYTSQWLPWDPVPFQASQDPVDRNNLHVFDANRECAPGFLLFRRNRFRRNVVGDKFLVVFLVGEAPTRGIFRQDQFMNALRGWRALELRDIDQQPPTLRILGPTFSASLPTLDTLLQAQSCKAPTADTSACFDRAQVVSGSVATSRRLVLQSGNFPGLAAANFISMGESSKAVQDTLVDYLGRTQHISPEQIAFVSEDETPFGNLLSSIPHSGRLSGTQQNSDDSTAPPSPSGRQNSTPDPTKRPMQFHYPREISQLRNAYEKNSVFSRQSGQQTSTQNQQDLTLSLEDRHEEEDSVPSFSSTQSPVSEESVLSEIMRAMDRERIRVAVINGTDVLDVVFVARYLGRSLPDLRVVLLNNDLLFDRSPDVSYFRGMLAVNTYPLIPDNIQWSDRFLSMPGYKPDHASPFGSILPDRIFASFETTGIYNAVRLLERAPFENAPADADSAKKSADDPVRLSSEEPLWLAEYSDPFRGGNHPPLWLTAVGRGGFWPVALLDRYLDEKGATTSDRCTGEVQTRPDESSSPSSLVDICTGNSGPSNDAEMIPPRMFDRWWWSPISVGGFTLQRPEAKQLLPARLAAVCLLALFILFGLILCVFARVDRWPQYVFDIPGTNGERRVWIVLIIILSYSWIGRLLILDLPYGFFRDTLNWGLLSLEFVLLVFAVWLIQVGFIKGMAEEAGTEKQGKPQADLTKWQQRRTKWEKRRVTFACGLIFLTLVSQVLFHWVMPSDVAAKLFYLYRSQHLFSGVCPVLPFIFLFIAVICLVSRHIQSLLAFSTRHKPRIPSYGGKNSPQLLQFITKDNVKDILLACYSPWRMLYSKRQQLKERGNVWLTRLLAFTAVMLLLSAYLLFPRGFETFEPRAYAILLSIFTFGLVLVMLHEIAWVILMWVCLHKGLLRPLERSILRACFSRVSGFSWQRLWFSIDQSPAVRYKPLSRAHESMRRMYLDPYCPQDVRSRIEDARKVYTRFIAVPESDDGKERSRRVRAFKQFQFALCRCATEVVAKIISEPSRHKEPLATSLDVPAKDIEEALNKSCEADSLEANAEEFVGLIYIYAIQHVLLDIRSHILAFTFSYFFLLMALNAYPVVPHHSIMVLLIGLLLAFVIVVVIVFSQMHRDSILSRTTSTEPGKLDIAFYEKLISVLGVPLIGLLASQFPEISNFLFSWLEPSLQTLK
jgi:hypothetical protein